MKSDLVIMGLSLAALVAVVATSSKTFVAGVRTVITPGIFDVGPAYLMANQPPFNGAVSTGIIPPMGQTQMGAPTTGPQPAFSFTGCASCGGM